MEKWRFNSMLFNRGLEYRCGVSEDPSVITDMDDNIHGRLASKSPNVQAFFSSIHNYIYSSDIEYMV
jgi:hypothetical protein